MTEKQETINKFYALRSGMSVLSMQYDEYFKICCEMDDIYVAFAKKLDEIIKLDFNGYTSHPKWDWIYNDIVGYIEKKQWLRLPKDGGFWYDHIYQTCYYDLKNYNPNTVISTYYKQRKLLSDKFNYREIIVSKAQFDEWMDTFIGKADYILDNANRAIQGIPQLVCYGDTLYSLIPARIRDIIIGEWLLTNEAQTHFKRKLVEITEILNILYYNIESLKPHGFFEKLFNKDKNLSEITHHQDVMNTGLVAAHNTENAIKFIEREAPKIKATIDNRQQKIGTINLEYNQIFRALQDEFSILLDVRDWENLDLVIYFMETGRADTVKEALQQVDMEKRTDRIVNTIHEATDRICSTIAMGFAALNASMIQCFAVIESRVAEQNALLSQQNSAIAELTSATNMNNALIAKQNTSSEKLMKDIKSLKSAVTA